MAEWAVGDTVAGLYRVLAVYTSGGMGLVYRVRHVGWNIDLAVKSPRPEMFRTDEDREQFIGEAHAWVSLGLHPHVCGCHYVRTLDAIPRVFAEYVGGGNLREWIREGELYRGGHRRSLQRILDVAVQVAWGLGHAHDNRLVHQDVKPANVLMNDDGAAKVTDFGLAKARSALSTRGSAGRSEDASMLVVGVGYTPSYASPEQVALRPLSRRTDVYSLALAVLEMFAGTVFWPAGMPGRVALDSYLSGGPPAAHLPPMPDAVAALLRACLHPAPDDRPHTMTDVVDGLVAAYAQALDTPYPRQPPVVAGLRADELSNRALSHLDLGQPDAARTSFQAAISVDPRNLHATYNYGLMRWRAGEMFDDALVAAVADARASSADADTADRMLTEVHLERGAVADARPVVEATMERDGRAGDPAVDTGRLTDGSIADADRATDLVSATAHARLDHGGRLALVPEYPDTVVLWDVGDGRELRRMTVPHRRLRAVDLSDDRTVAVAGTDGGEVAVFDVGRGTRLHLLAGHTSRSGNAEHERRVSAVRVSADGRRAVSGGVDGTVRVWNLDTGREERRIDAHAGAVEGLDLSVSGRTVVSVGADRQVRVWDLADGGLAAYLNRPDTVVIAVAIAGDASRLAYGQVDGTVGVMDLTTGVHLVVRGHSDPVLSVSLARDGRTLASIGRGGLVRIWAADTLRCLRTCDGGPLGRTELYPGDLTVRHDTDGRRVLSVVPGQVREWGVPLGYVAPFHVSRPRPGAVLVAADLAARDALGRADAEVDAGRFAAALAALREARAVPGHERSFAAMTRWRRLGTHTVHTGLRGAWDTTSLSGHDGAVAAIAVCEKPDMVVSAGTDGRIQGWNLASFEATGALRTEDPILAMDIAQAADRVVYAGRDAVLVWRPVMTEDGRPDIVGIGSGVRAPLAANADGRYAVASTDNDTRLTLWNLDDGSAVRTVVHRGLLHRVCLSGDGRLAATIGFKTLRVYDLEAGRPLGELYPHQRPIRAVAFSPDLRLGLSAGEDRTIHLFDPATGAAVRTLTGHTRGVVTAAFSPDGRFVASAGEDATVRIWDVATGECLRTLDMGSHQPTVVRFSADAGYLLLGTLVGRILVWELDWELSAPEPADWDDGADPTLTAFLALHTPVGEDAPAAMRTGEWVDAHVDALLARLRPAGFGWLRRDGVRAALARAASTWTRPAPRADLTGAVSDADRVDTSGWPPARSKDELHVYITEALTSCTACGSRDIDPTTVTTEYPDGSTLFRGLQVRCEACSTTVDMPFRIVDNGELTSSYDRWFGGAEPSTVVGPAQWLAHADRHAAVTPTTEWTAGMAAAAVAEVLKFIPDGADRVPDAVVDRFGGATVDPATLTRSALRARLDGHLRDLDALRS